MAKKRKVQQAVLLASRYGEFRKNDTIKGELAQKLVDAGLAKDTTPSPARKAQQQARRSKKKGGAPENKSFDAKG